LLHFLKSRLSHFLYCVNEHSLHSPLVYDFYTKVLKPFKKKSPEIEILRGQLQKDDSVIYVEDYGTGAGKNPNRKISSILGRAVSNGDKATLIRDIASFFECSSIVELGTSLGLTTMYLASVNSSKVVTFEGSESLSKLASKHFNKLGFSNIEIITGNIDQTFPHFLSKSEKFDLYYFDANHRYQPTMNYYNLARSRSSQSTIFIFDDIHYSPEMEKAWNEISKKTEVTLSIDLFNIGIVGFDPSRNKKHYILSFF